MNVSKINAIANAKPEDAIINLKGIKPSCGVAWIIMRLGSRAYSYTCLLYTSDAADEMD